MDQNQENKLMLTSKTDSLIDSATQSIHSHATAQAQHANRMARALLDMPDAELTAWLRLKHVELQAQNSSLEILFTRHSIVGTTLNTLLETTASQLNAPLPELVDVRPVAVKLADMRRVIDWQTLTISTLPEPQPEPPTE
jgi:hypothetical protein